MPDLAKTSLPWGAVAYLVNDAVRKASLPLCGPVFTFRYRLARVLGRGKWRELLLRARRCSNHPRLTAEIGRSLPWPAEEFSRHIPDDRTLDGASRRSIVLKAPKLSESGI
jgi:hypothetical protein